MRAVEGVLEADGGQVYIFSYVILLSCRDLLYNIVPIIKIIYCALKFFLRM